MKTVFSVGFWIDLWRAVRTSVLGALGEILLVLLLFFVGRAILFKVIDRIWLPIGRLEGPGQQSRAARIRTLQVMVKSAASYMLFFVTAMMILRALHVDPIPILTTASVAGLAVGFGAQKLVRDVISGFFIILEDQYSVGDYVTISGATGVVEEIGMRMTRLRDDVGKLVILSNGDIAMVTNHSRGAITSTMDLALAPTADLSRAENILNEIGREIAAERNDVFAPFACQGVTAMGAAQVSLRLEGKVDPRNQDDILMDLRSRIRSRFLEEKIDLV